MISKLALRISEGGTAVNHELIGNSIAKVEFANRNRIAKSEVQLNSTTATKRCLFRQNTVFYWTVRYPFSKYLVFS